MKFGAFELRGVASSSPFVPVAGDSTLASHAVEQTGLTILRGSSVERGVPSHKECVDTAHADVTASSEASSLDMLASRALKFISQGVLISGSDGKILSANDAFLRITQYSLDEVLGKTCQFLQGPATETASIDAIRDALNSEQEFSGDVINYRKHGEWFWNELTITPVHDLQAKLTHFIGIIRDVTARKRAQAAEKASDQRYRQLVENIPAAVVVHGPQSEILIANAGASKMLGLSLEQMKGLVAIHPCWKFIREDGSPMALDEYPVNQVLATRKVIKDVVLGVARPDREEPVWVMCNGFPVLDAKGALSEVVISFTNVTVLKQAERATQKSEERLRLVLQASQDAPWDWDLVANSIYYSPRWWQMIGRQADEESAASDLWARCLHPEDRVRVAEIFGGALQSGVDSYEVEFRLRHKNGHYVPVLSRGFILRDADGAALRVSGTNTDLTQQKQAEERIHQLAYYDALTNLPNRRLLMEQLRKALLKCARSSQQGALLFIDLDNFKVLNDTLGHDVGDRLLRQVGDRVTRAVRTADTVGRLGGDEFLVMLEELGDVPSEAAIAAEVIAQNIHAALVEPYVLEGRLHHSTPSIGIALFDKSSDSLDLVLKQADLAMYQAKAKGRNTLRFFDATMQASVDERVALERDLRQSLLRGELVLHYQPQVDAECRVFGAEALVRWQHPTRGLVSPGTFIPIAEATGLILPLGLWVLETACKRLVNWSERTDCKHLTLAVNVSAHQFREPDFVPQVLDVLQRTGAPAQRLKLELTESLLAENIEDIIVKMSTLQAHGVRFALDDFGTGYSSLSYLKRLPLDQLKIDQSFVRDVLTDSNDATIARVIITLAANLGLAVIAEGVETEGQRRFLESNGCIHYQGYLFGRPVPVDQFEAQLPAAG